MDDQTRPNHLTHLAPQDRPREKLEQSGVASLGDNELLALVLGHGTVGANALTVANALLAASGGAHGLTRISRAQLARVPGIGAALACRVQAAVELGRRTLYVSPPARQQFLRPVETARFLLPRFGAYPVERFGVMMLDTRRRLIRAQLISIGSLDAASAHPREVFREAAIAGAAAVVVFHNHPSGDPTPSIDDVALTRRLAAAGEIVGIDLDDHLILADTRYVSMRASEVMKWPG
jgi:DNA repair protein RadC